MLSRGFQIFLSVLIYICSTLAGMAQTTTPKEVRADFFVANELDETTDRQTSHTLDDFALPACISSAAQTENTVDSGKNKKRNQKRTAPFRLNHSKCRILKSLPEKSEARGVARNPQSQDARQERTATIRFLHQKSLPKT